MRMANLIAEELVDARNTPICVSYLLGQASSAGHVMRNGIICKIVDLDDTLRTLYGRSSCPRKHVPRTNFISAACVSQR